ncbi:hypothetical protein XM38_007170 [Halomicronema hongdechloris C2206]|uniref:Uncharacterized protein n=1 Tax=Halomicronema hongdechloris C2206 TaxID=1641165 RepID=A0A1Z3HHP4_9CYAN|nr:hypothetical protein [Halomicronema hongdechloris]ASC69788.1 hypothetical protein XM38_007170 [Halomicronema hongdechloris C2206]
MSAPPDPTNAAARRAKTPSDPDLQQRAKQIQSALNSQQLSPEAAADIAHLVEEIDPASQSRWLLSLFKAALQSDVLTAEELTELAQTINGNQAHQRIDTLVEQTQQILCQKTLGAEAQAELSRLLSLLPYLPQRPDLVAEFELAVAALTQVRADQSDAQHLKLGRNLRRHLAIHLKQDENPLGSLVRASGSPHNRLVAGLTWFLLIFTGIPALVSAGFFLSGVAEQRDRIEALVIEVQDQQDTIDRQSRQLASFTGALGAVDTQLASVPTTTTNPEPATNGGEVSPLPLQQLAATLADNVLASRRRLSTLTHSNGDLANLKANVQQLAADSTAAGQLPQTIINDLNQLETDLQQLYDNLGARSGTESNQLIANVLPAAVAELEQTVQRQHRSIGQARTLIDDALVAEADRSQDNQTEAPDTAQSSPPNETDGRAAADGDAANGDSEDFLETLLDSISGVNFPLILAVMATGALGSFVSVIVRANEFVSKESEAQLDLFLVGFFRPVVGMAFAFFLIAVLESGVFSGFLSLQPSQNNKKIYLYITIAFVAGFSERLVRDIMGHTESLVNSQRPR